LLVFGLLLAAAFLYTMADLRQSRVAQEVRQLTGARTRVVWCRQIEGEGYDALGSRLMLMGLDTDDRAGERQLVRRVGSYWKPMISPRGDRVVFTDFPKAVIRVVNWNGSGLRELFKGYALHVWLDPATGREWVYAVDADGREKYAGRPLIRFLLDNPFQRETVWDATPVHFDNLRLSLDGKRAAGLFPWPVAGVIDMEARTLTEFGRGCWPDLSPDNHYIRWVFDGAHRNLQLRSADGPDGWKVVINDAPGVDGDEVDCPRWGNQIRFLTLTGPHKRAKREGSQARGEGEEIYVGRFDKGLTRIEQWARVTRNEWADFFSDVWVEPTTDMGGVFTPASRPGAGGRMVVQARLVETTTIPTLESIAPYRQALVVYAYEVESVMTGAYGHERLMVAHWGLVRGIEHPIPRIRGASYRMALDRLDDHPELEGERVIMDMKAGVLPIYYEINR